MAHLSLDEGLIEAFNTVRTCTRSWRRGRSAPIDEVTPDCGAG